MHKWSLVTYPDRLTDDSRSRQYHLPIEFTVEASIGNIMKINFKEFLQYAVSNTIFLILFQNGNETPYNAENLTTTI